MHKDPEFKKLCEDVASATNVDKILEEVNRGDHGKVIVMTNCGRLLAGGNPETRGKYILDAKDAQGFPVFREIVSAANAPSQQDYFVNGVVHFNSDSSMTGYLIRAQYLHDQGLVFAKVYIQDLNQKDVVGKADGVFGTMW